MEILTLPAHLGSLDTIGHYVLKVAQQAGVSRPKAYKLRLAVDELITNAILYGCANCGEDAKLEVWAEIDADSLKIIVADTGKPYDSREREFDQSILSKPIEERQIGGLGIFLALQNVDEFLYEVKDDKNISSFCVKLSDTEKS